MKKILFFVALCFSLQSLFAQAEISVYGGLMDFPGLSIEYKFANKISIDLSSSYRFRKGDIIFADSSAIGVNTNTMLTLAVKKYVTGDKNTDNFFYGGYVRYWQTDYYLKDIDRLTPDQQAYAFQNALTISNTAHKISIGGLAGYKFYLGNKFTITLTGVLGFSTKKSYWSVIQEYNHPVRTYPYYSNDFLGYWNRLSGIGRLSVGYRF